MDEQKKWYWLLITHGNKGINFVPFRSAEPTPSYPVADQCLGYATSSEALEAHDILLNAPKPEMVNYMKVIFPARLARGEVQYRRP